jgi:hypothetical protein
MQEIRARREAMTQSSIIASFAAPNKPESRKPRPGVPEPLIQQQANVDAFNR